MGCRESFCRAYCRVCSPDAAQFPVQIASPIGSPRSGTLQNPLGMRCAHATRSSGEKQFEQWVYSWAKTGPDRFELPQVYPPVAAELRLTGPIFTVRGRPEKSAFSRTCKVLIISLALWGRDLGFLARHFITNFSTSGADLSLYRRT